MSGGDWWSRSVIVVLLMIDGRLARVLGDPVWPVQFGFLANVELPNTHLKLTHVTRYLVFI